MDKQKSEQHRKDDHGRSNQQGSQMGGNQKTSMPNPGKSTHQNDKNKTQKDPSQASNQKGRDDNNTGE